jgi:hypothetical protein
MPRSKFNRQNARNVERQRQAWELFKHGANYTEIGKALGVNRSTAFRLVDKEKKLLLTEQAEDIEEYRVEELSRLDVVIREAMNIVTGKCRDCRGAGMLRADGLSTDILVECETCDGSGRRYGSAQRMSAMDKLMKAVDTRSKLRGLYAPEKIAMTNTKGEDILPGYEEQINGWSEEDIDRELAELLAVDADTAEDDDL